MIAFMQKKKSFIQRSVQNISKNVFPFVGMELNSIDNKPFILRNMQIFICDFIHREVGQRIFLKKRRQY